MGAALTYVRADGYRAADRLRAHMSKKLITLLYIEIQFFANAGQGTVRDFPKGFSLKKISKKFLKIC